MIIKKETLFSILSVIVFTAFCLIISTAAFAQEDGYGEPEPPPEMLDHTDITKVIDLIKRDYYESIPGEKLLESFLAGVSDYSKKKGIENPLKSISRPENVRKAVGEIGNAFKKAKISGKDSQPFLHAGIEGMIMSLNNPGCEFFLPGKYRASLAEMGYNKGGCGFFVDDKKKDSEGRWIIIETLQDFPAEKEGVQSGDRLISVNGKSVKEMTFRELARVVRGPIGSKVSLTVYRPGDKKEITVTIRRTWLGPNPKSIRTEVLNDDIGYLKFRYLGERMEVPLQDIQKMFDEKKVNAVIWDARNSAGLMNGAVDLASHFAPEDKVFAYRIFKDSQESYKGKGNERLKRPVVVLVNKYTSAACLFIALVLKEHYHVVLLGRPVEWDGDSVSSHRLRDDSYITLTYSYYKLENGTILKNKSEIKPDIDIGQHPLPPYSNGDEQLKKAIEYIKEKIK